MEALEVAKAIQLKISQLDKMKGELRPAIDEFCKAASAYDKQVAVSIVKIKNGVEVQIDPDHTIKNPPASVMERLAKGMCYQEKLTMDTAEQVLKALYTRVRITEAQLNGYQSINRYLSEV